MTDRKLVLIDYQHDFWRAEWEVRLHQVVNRISGLVRKYERAARRAGKSRRRQLNNKANKYRAQRRQVWIEIGRRKWREAKAITPFLVKSSCLPMDSLRPDPYSMKIPRAFLGTPFLQEPLNLTADSHVMPKDLWPNHAEYFAKPRLEPEVPPANKLDT